MIDVEAVLVTLGARTHSRSKKMKHVAAAEEARDLVRNGMPARALDLLAKEVGVSLAEMQFVVGIPPATAARKRATKNTLKPAQSDRVFRIARILTLATHVLENRDKAARWLRQANQALRGEIPYKMLDTEIGAREVEQVLERIEYGVYS